MIACLVCGGTRSEQLCRMWSVFLEDLRRAVVICRDCGHIQIDPLFAPEEYARINNAFFGMKYLVDDELHPDNAKKIEVLSRRIEPVLSPGMRVLDVGAGEGWALDYFKAKSCPYHAIEHVPRLKEGLVKRGGKVIGASLFDDLKAYAASYDLILFRHVLEHMQNPGGAIGELKKLLKPKTGLLYLVLPNSAHVKAKKGFVTNFLRPVHISYFHPKNVIRLIEAQGLQVQSGDHQGEIFFMLRNEALGDLNAARYENLFETQKNYFRKLIKENRRTDFWTSLRYFFRHHLKPINSA